MSDDQQNTAEAIDPDELGDDPEGTASFPPEHLLGADDPTRDDHVIDSLAERELRRDLGMDEPGDDEGLRLAAPNDVLDDDEAEAIGDAIEADDLTAEEAAIHTER